MRVAIYFTPPADAASTRLAAEWLGRDAFTGSVTRRPDAEIDPLVAEPARYGFHATIKAPFRLAANTTLDELEERLAAFCREQRTTPIDRIALRRIERFFALVPDGPHPEIEALAKAAVRAFEPFRAPLTDEEIRRRRPERLSDRQQAYLAEWGYPYVLDEFRFHMTLTGPVEEPDAAAVEARLRERFAPLIDHPLPVEALALFVEPEPGAPFRVRSIHPLASA